MKKLIASIALILSTTLSYGADASHDLFGVETTVSSYFDEIYLYNNLVHYLDQRNLHITYQTDTTGEFNQPDQMVFSVDGNSFRWNKYYIDGFRIDSRFFAGSTLYHTNMSNYNLALDYINSELHFGTSESRKQYAEVNYNFGDLGGTSIGTTAFIRMLHATAADRAYKPIEDRNHTQGSGSADINFAIKGRNGRSYMQNVYLNFGQREFVDLDQTGINGYFDENYGEFQMGGELPLTLGGLFDQTNYIARFSQRDHLYAELYYGKDESPELQNYAVSLYGSKRRDDISYTSGFNFAINRTQHDNLNYSRNVIDQDGEGFEPWMPDGSNIDLSYSLTIDKRLNEWLNLSYDGYNSFLRFTPSQNNFYNTTYSQLLNDAKPTMLYLYEWESRAFCSALLENSVGLNTHRKLSDNLDFRASLDLTLDAMLVSGNSIVSPNVEFRAGLEYKPSKWFELEFNVGRERVNYNIEDIKFLSDDYLSGEVYYIDDSGEKGGLFTTTGGAYHSLGSNTKQSSYYTVDIPINITLGRHRINLLQSYRKYCNTWSVGFDGDYSDYGYMEQVTPVNYTYGALDPVDIFYFDGGKEVNYVVGDYPSGVMGDNFFTSTPYFFCSNIEYTYTAPRLTLTLNWQSYMMSGLSTLGNGPISNNIGTLSESSANPNTYQVLGNPDSPYQAVGRMDQDRAYIARIFLSYKITPKLLVALNAKFKDGQPFSSYQVKVKQDDGGNQIAIFPETSRGTNNADGNFGSREDGVYNIDLRVKYNTTIAKRACEFGVQCYNIYDFGNELSEYIFNQDMADCRNAMSLTIPRGLIFSFKINL